MDYIVEGEGCTASTTDICGKLVGCAGFELQSGWAGDVDSSIEGDGDSDSRTDAVAAVSSGGGDSGNFGSGVKQDGGGGGEGVRRC